MARWVIADTHFSHANIIVFEHRPFGSTQEMDEVMTRNWNKVVRPDDEVWHLGDVAMLPASRIMRLIGLLHGQKHLVLGNHDRGHSLTFWERAGFQKAYSSPVEIPGGILLSHERIAATKGLLNLHGHGHGRTPLIYGFWHRCVSVENIGYTPADIDLFLMGRM